MKVTLNIENDAELRAYIKDCIKGQVLSVARSEIKNIVTDALKMKYPDAKPSFEFLMKEEIRNMVKNELSSKSYGTPSFIQMVARDIIEKEIKEVLSNKYTNIIK